MAKAPMARLAGAMAVCGLAASAAIGAKGPFRDERNTSHRVEFAGSGTRTIDARTISGSIHVTGDGGRDVRGLRASIQLLPTDVEAHFNDADGPA